MEKRGGRHEASKKRPSANAFGRSSTPSAVKAQRKASPAQTTQSTQAVTTSTRDSASGQDLQARNNTAAMPAADPLGTKWYAPLSGDLSSGGAALALSLDKSKGSITEMLHELMATNPRASDARAIAGGKLKDRTLMLDNPAMQRKQSRHHRGGHDLISKLLRPKQYKAMDMYDIRKDDITYVAFPPSLCFSLSP